MAWYIQVTFHCRVLVSGDVECSRENVRFISICQVGFKVKHLHIPSPEAPGRLVYLGFSCGTAPRQVFRRNYLPAMLYCTVLLSSHHLGVSTCSSHAGKVSVDWMPSMMIFPKVVLMFRQILTDPCANTVCTLLVYFEVSISTWVDENQYEKGKGQRPMG